MAVRKYVGEEAAARMVEKAMALAGSAERVGYVVEASKWSGGSYDLDAEMGWPVGANDVSVEPDFDAADEAQLSAWREAAVRGTHVLNRLVAQGGAPTVDVPVVLEVSRADASAYRKTFAEATDGELAWMLSEARAGRLDLEEDCGWELGQSRSYGTTAMTLVHRGGELCADGSECQYVVAVSGTGERTYFDDGYCVVPDDAIAKASVGDVSDIMASLCRARASLPYVRADDGAWRDMHGDEENATRPGSEASEDTFGTACDEAVMGYGDIELSAATRVPGADGRFFVPSATELGLSPDLSAFTGEGSWSSYGEYNFMVTAPAAGQTLAEYMARVTALESSHTAYSYYAQVPARELFGASGGGLLTRTPAEVLAAAWWQTHYTVGGSCVECGAAQYSGHSQYCSRNSYRDDPANECPSCYAYPGSYHSPDCEYAPGEFYEPPSSEVTESDCSYYSWTFHNPRVRFGLRAMTAAQASASGGSGGAADEAGGSHASRTLQVPYHTLI